jgi:hypothetical protein
MYNSPVRVMPEQDLETSPLQDPIRVLKTWHLLVPERRPVVRHNPDSDDEILSRWLAPMDLWVLPAAAATNHLVAFTPDPTMVREEYVDLLDSILLSLHLGRRQPIVFSSGVRCFITC